MVEIALQSLIELFSPLRLGFLFAGTLMGLFLGAIPGLGGIVGLAILLPFTFDLVELRKNYSLAPWRRVFELNEIKKKQQDAEKARPARLEEAKPPDPGMSDRERRWRAFSASC